MAAGHRCDWYWQMILPTERSDSRTSVVLLRILSLLLALGLALSGCGGGGDDDDEFDVDTTVFDATPTGGILRFINAIPDSPQLFVEYVASWDGSAGLDQLNFTDGALHSPIASGFDVQVSYLKPNGELVVLFEFLQDEGDTDIEVAVEDDKTLVLSGSLDDPTYRLIELEEYRYGLELPEEDEVLTVDPEAVFVHALPGAEMLDFYLTESSVALSTVAPTVTLGYLDYSPALSVEPRDDYRIRVTPLGEPDTVLFDSGSFEFGSNTREIFTTVDYFGPGDNALQVVPLSMSFDEGELPNALRVANLVADVPTVDIFFGDTADAPAFPAVGFQEITGFVEQEAQDVFVNVTPTGLDNRFVYQGDLVLPSGAAQTLYVTGLLETDDGTAAVAGTLVTEDVRPVASEILLRAVQGAASMTSLDVHILAPGQFSADVTATFPAMSLGNTSIGGFEPGDYDLVVVDSGNGTEVFGPERITLTSGNLYTLLVSESAGGGAPLDVALHETTVTF